MSKITSTTLAIALIIMTSGAAFADADHHTADKAGSDKAPTQSPGPMGGDHGQMGMMGGNHHEMMQGMMKMMMQMHGGMMIGDMGHMGAFSPQEPKDRDILSLMPGQMMDQSDAGSHGAMADGKVHSQMQSMHSDADTDGDGVLSLEEFDVLHSKTIRPMMIDRFQHLDTDGDGKVTTGEMTAPADRMKMRSSTE